MNNKYFSFCAGSTWRTGLLSGCCVADNALIIESDGLYISKALDSGEDDTVWRSAEMDFTETDGGKVFIMAYASDIDYIIHDKKKIMLDDIFLSDTVPDDQKREFFKSLDPYSTVNARNAPLFTLRGRYLWFMLEFYSGEKTTLQIKEIKISYPMVSYLTILPQMYSKIDNTFLQSFMSVFRTEVERIDKKIVDIYKEFDVDLVSESGLKRLVKWHGLPVSDIWEPERIRELVRNADYLYRMKGTKTAFELLFGILLSCTPKILENRFSSTADQNEFSFSIYINAGLVRSTNHYNEIVKLTDHFKPAGTTARIMLIRDDSYLSESSFLDENAVLADWAKNTLDGDMYITDDYIGSSIIL